MLLLHNRISDVFVALALCAATCVSAELKNAPRSQPNPSIDTQAICAEVVSFANKGKLNDRFLSFSQASSQDTNRWERANQTADAPTLTNIVEVNIGRVSRTFGRTMSHGTCPSREVSDLSAPWKESSNYTWDDEDLRWAGWGTYEQLIVLRGTAIAVATGVHRGSQYISLVSVIDSRGAKFPLCTIESMAPYRVTVRASNNEGLCKSIANNRTVIAPWTEKVNFTESQMTELGTRTDSASGARIDLNGDGRKELVVLVSDESAAGCGAERAQLAALKIDDSYGPSIELTKLLERIGRGPIEGPPAFNWQGPAIHFFRGKPYVLSIGNTSTANLAVTSIWKNEVRTWCELNVLRKHRVKTLLK